jgi:GTP cyclohydrolase II
LGSTDCDCALQLEAALDTVSKEGGAVVYLYQEGRGVGLFRKVTAMALQAEKSIDTANAYMRLGYDPDPRDYSAVVEALASIDFPSNIRIATNNPRKIEALQRSGFNVQRVAQKLKLTAKIRKYVLSKVRGLNHYGTD